MRRLMNCGLECEIIRYGGCYDIDVKFDDGTVVTTKLDSFKYRGIRYPSMPKNGSLLPKYRIGISHKMNDGRVATIIDYRTPVDMDIRYDDGEVVTGLTWNNFINGVALGEQSLEISGVRNLRFSKNERLREERVGERRKTFWGDVCEVVKYNTCDDIDVKFEDGAIRTGITYASFLAGNVRHPSLPRRGGIVLNDRVGEKKLMKCGVCAEILEYRSAMDIDIRFDSGEVQYCRVYRDFRLGELKPRLHGVLTLENNEKERSQYRYREGEIIFTGTIDDITMYFKWGRVARFYVCGRKFNKFLVKDTADGSLDYITKDELMKASEGMDILIREDLL